MCREIDGHRFGSFCKSCFLDTLTYPWLAKLSSCRLGNPFNNSRDSLITHTQKLGAQLAPPAFQGLRLACCVADMHDSRLMIFSVLLVIRITKTDGVPCGENIELVQTRTPCILLSQEIVPQISDLNSNRSRSFIRASVHHSANRQTEVVVVKSFFLGPAVAQDGGGGGGGNFF